MSVPDLSGFSLTDDYDPGAGEGTQPRIVSFSAASSGASPGQLPHSLQIVKGATVVLSWKIEGTVDELNIDGPNVCPPPTSTQLTVTPAADMDYTLRARNGFGEDKQTVHVAVHEEAAPASAHLRVQPAGAPAGKGVIDDGKNIIVDPPVRLLAQYDKRWGATGLGGASNNNTVKWQKDGCSPSCAAMVLRWFAEDRKVCAFPEIPEGSKIPADHYGQRMGEAFWPEGFQYYSTASHKEPPGNPQGRVSLMGKEGVIDYPDIFDYAAYWLRHSGIPPGKKEKDRQLNAHGTAYSKYDLPTDAEGRMGLIRNLLKSGPCILGLGAPGGHFVVCEGVRDGALLIVDPGAVLNTAVVGNGEQAGGKWIIANWHGKQGFETLKEGKGKPPKSQWPRGLPADGIEYDEKCYIALSGQVLQEVLKGLLHVHSLTFPDFKPPEATAPAPAQEKPQAAPPAVEKSREERPADKGASSCARCDEIEKLVGSGVEKKIRRGSPDKAAVKLLQYHLVDFGYDLGTSGPGGDGVDGEFGNLTAAALKKFLSLMGAEESGEALSDAGARLLLKKHKGGATTDAGAPAPAAPAKPAEGPVSSKVEVFFKYRGWIGPAYGRGQYEKNKQYAYVAYRVPGKTAWFLRGRGNVDLDGAPNAYHPDPAMNRNFVHAGELPTWDVMRLDRPLENLANGPVGMQKKDGKLYVQTASDPCPGYYVMHTPLRRKQFDAWNPREYSDARIIPYFAIPTQILGQANSPSKLPGFGGWEAVGTGHTGGFGDYVTAVNLAPRAYKNESYPPGYLTLIELNGKKYPIAHGIIGDAGNQPHIGECSYALGKLLHTLNGPEWADVLWMIHPGSGKGQYFIPEPAEIRANGEKLFQDWGGQKQLAAVLQLPELSSSGR